MTRRPPFGSPRERFVPPVDTLDSVQLAACLRLTLSQMLRPGRDLTTGAHVNPLRQIGLAMGLMGVVFSANAWRLPPEDFLALAFAVGVLLVVLAIAPDTPEIRQQVLEVLHSRPVSERTLVAATGVRLLALSALIAGVFGLAPAIALAWRGGIPVLPAVSAVACLVLTGGIAAALWLLAMLVLLRWISVSRFRSLCQVGMLVLVLTVMALSLGLPTGGLVDGEVARRIADWLPSTWFARLAWAPEGEAVLAQRLAAVGVVAGVALVAWRGGFEAAQSALRDDALASPQRRTVPTLGVRLVAAAARRPVLRSWVTPPVAATASVILAVTSREEVSRLKLFAPRLLTVLTLVAGLLMEQPLVPLAMIGILSFSAVFEGLEVLRQSGDAPASWVFWKAPVEREALLRGLWLALAIRYLLLPVGVAAVLLGRELHAAVAASLLVALGAGLHLAFAVGLWVRPGLPLASEQRTTQSLLGFGLASVVSIGWTLGALAVGAIGLRSPGLAVTAALLASGSLAAARWSLERLAERRLERLEFLG